MTTFNETAAQILSKSAAHPEHVVTTDEGTVDLNFFDTGQNQFLLKTAPHESGDKIYCQIYVIAAPGVTTAKKRSAPPSEHARKIPAATDERLRTAQGCGTSNLSLEQAT